MVIKTTNGTYDGGEYDVPITTKDYYYANLLLPVVETGTATPTETIDNEEYTNFSVGTLNGGAIGFVRVTSNWTTHNKSYLRVPTRLYESSASARQQGGFGIVFVEDETTGFTEEHLATVLEYFKTHKPELYEKYIDGVTFYLDGI
jgi:hypothetical protein